MLHKDDLHAEVQAFMDENCTNLEKDSTEYTMAFWARMCIPFCIPVPAGPRFPEFRFHRISGFRQNTRQN